MSRGCFSNMGTQTGTIKLKMAAWYLGLVALISSIVGLLATSI